MFIKDTYTKYPIIKFTIDRPLYFVLCKHNLTVIILGLKNWVKSLVLLFFSIACVNFEPCPIKITCVWQFLSTFPSVTFLFIRPGRNKDIVNELFSLVHTVLQRRITNSPILLVRWRLPLANWYYINGAVIVWGWTARMTSGSIIPLSKHIIKLL